MQRITAFHGTNAVFSEFSLAAAARPGMSGNGHLGIWLAAAQELASRFGEHVLTVELAAKQIYRMPLSELSRFNQDCRRGSELLDTEADQRGHEQAFYEGHRQRLLAQGYGAIALVEADGRVEMFIGLDCTKLRIVAHN